MNTRHSRGLQLYADLWLLPNEVLVDSDGRFVELVEVHNESARGVLGELFHDDETAAQAVGVV